MGARLAEAPPPIVKSDEEETQAMRAAAALCPIFCDLSRGSEDSPQVMNLKWKVERDGGTLVRAVPDTGAQVSVTPADMAQGHKIHATEASKSGRGFTPASKHQI